ncbi:MAG: hypothetical protein ACXAC8_13625 [Candidatus Hodarchaeales archaeon]|jgi:hypothetical protein
MNFPCSHCGSEESFADRKTDDFKPIVPVELQGNFEEPPEFVADSSSIPTSLSNDSDAKPVSKPPVLKESSYTPPTPPIVTPPKSDVKPDSLEGPPIIPPQPPTSLKRSPMEEAHNISRVVEGMVTKTEETGYRTFVKHRLSDIEATIQSIKSDIQSLIEGQKNIENMLKGKEEQESEKKKDKKGRWRK